MPFEGHARKFTSKQLTILTLSAIFLGANCAAHAATSWTFCWAKGPNGVTYRSDLFGKDYGYSASGYDPQIYGRIVNKWVDFLSSKGITQLKSSGCLVPTSNNNNQNYVSAQADSNPDASKVITIDWPNDPTAL